MDDIEILRVSIKDLENAYNNVVEAMNNIVDVEGAENEYKELDQIAETIDNLRIDFQVELENLKEQEQEERYLKRKYCWGE